MRIGYKSVNVFNDSGTMIGKAVLKLQIIGPVAGIKNVHRRLQRQAGDLDNKSRCGKVKVLEARMVGYDPIGGKKFWAKADTRANTLRSRYAYQFRYYVGSYRVPTRKFKMGSACGFGIHFFWSLKDALYY